MKHPTSTIAVAVVLILSGLNAPATPQEVERPPPSLYPTPTPNYESFTDHFNGSVTKVLPNHALMIKDEQTKSFRFLRLTPTTKLKAKRKSEFGGRKNLEFKDLAPGQPIKVTYLIATGKILKITVLDQAPVSE